MIFGKHINRYYFRYSWLLLLGVAALFMVDYFQLEIPELYRAVVNGLQGKTNDGAIFDLNYLLDEICRPLIFIILFMVFGRFLWRICFFNAGTWMETDLRNRMFSHCKNLSREYYQVNKVGSLMSLFTNDLSTVQECFGWGILMLFDAVVLGGMAIVKMWFLDSALTLFSLIPMAVLMVISIFVGTSMMKKWDVRQKAYSDLSDFSQESFSGISVIKAFVKELKELLAFRKLNEENEVANVEYTRSSTLLRILVTLFVESVVCVILGYGGYLVYENRFDAGQLIEFIGYFTAIIWPVMAVSELIDLTSRAKASLRRISKLLDAKIDVTDRDGVEMMPQIEGNIEFRNLSFRYPDGEFDALRHVSFTVNAGERVGLVGKTGSGKTTVVDLILRTYNVPDGTLFIDGRDVNKIRIHDVRAGCAYVPQDNFLFSDTIANNIAFATDSVDDESVECVAKLADVHGNITEFTDGYQTVLGERGVTVSGGQKQRISIARALLKDAPILILDDSVSAVDTKTEKVILENLHETRKGKTTILIAHRISTVEDMDKIIFLDEGTVLAVGSHAQLYEDCEEYRRMVDLQKLEEGGNGNV